MTPFYDAGAFNYPVAMAIATVLGVAFGFILERSGFGRASVLVAQFYGDDMRVLKVMFTAIATTSIGIGILGGLGVVNIGWLDIPGSWIVPQIVAGTLLGVGFVISGYCPGTALVSIGSGFKDGLVALVGIMLGSLLFGALWGVVEPFYTADGQGTITFVDVLGVPWPILGLGVAVMAIGAFLGAEKLEGVLATRRGTAAPNDDPQLRNAVFGVLLVMAAIGLATLGVPEREEEAAELPEIGTMSVVTLAEHIVSGHMDTYIVDLRSTADCMEDRVRGAMCLPEDDAEANFLADLPATRTLVLYGASDLDEVPASVAEFEGAVAVLEGGYDAFQATIMETPEPPENPSSSDIEAYNMLTALHAYFTGSNTPAPPVVARPTVQRESAARGGGC